MSLPKRKITNIFEQCIGYKCPTKNISIIKCEKGDADVIIKKYHYSKKAIKNSCLSLLVVYHDKISGALQLGYGIRPKKKGKFSPDEILEFDRMWLSDEMPKFSETITLSLLHHFLRECYPNINYLISYADTSVGNTGTIYKAANYVQIGKIKADFYILSNGERVHPVSMWHRHKTRVWSFLQKEYPEIKKANGYQLKFLFTLKNKKNDNIRKTILRNNH